MITKKEMDAAVSKMGWTTRPLMKEKKPVASSYVLFTKRVAPVVMKIGKVTTIGRPGKKELFQGKISTSDELVMILRRLFM